MNVLQGNLIDSPNFPGWKTVPLVALLKKELGKRGIKKKVYFQNDAIAAALGEGWVGAAKGLQTYVMITSGTGMRTLTGKEPRELAELARRGDKQAKEIFAQASRALAGL